jgi:hypothetical protein
MKRWVSIFIYDIPNQDPPEADKILPLRLQDTAESLWQKSCVCGGALLAKMYCHDVH